MMYTCNGVLHNHKKKGNSSICDNTDESLFFSIYTLSPSDLIQSLGCNLIRSKFISPTWICALSSRFLLNTYNANIY